MLFFSKQIAMWQMFSVFVTIDIKITKNKIMTMTLTALIDFSCYLTLSTTSRVDSRIYTLFFGVGLDVLNSLHCVCILVDSRLSV